MANKELYAKAKLILRRNESLETIFGLSLFMIPFAETAFEKLTPLSCNCEIVQTSHGNFTVVMETIPTTTNDELEDETHDRFVESHMVYFGNESNFPSCTCVDWKASALPCQHMFAVFVKYDQFNYNSLSSMYRTSPVFELDHWCLKRRLEDENEGVRASQTSISTQTEGGWFRKSTSPALTLETSTLNKIKKLRTFLKSASTLFVDRPTYDRVSNELVNLERNFAKRLQNAEAKNSVKNASISDATFAQPAVDDVKENKGCVTNVDLGASVGPGLGKIIPAALIRIPTHNKKKIRKSNSTLLAKSSRLLENRIVRIVGGTPGKRLATRSSLSTPSATTADTQNNTNANSSIIVLPSDKLSKISPHHIVDQLKQSVKLRKAVHQEKHNDVLEGSAARDITDIISNKDKIQDNSVNDFDTLPQTTTIASINDVSVRDMINNEAQQTSNAITDGTATIEYSFVVGNHSEDVSTESADALDALLMEHVIQSGAGGAVSSYVSSVGQKRKLETLNSDHVANNIESSMYDGNDTVSKKRSDANED